MKTQKVLFATDFSSHCEAALAMATALARDGAGKLLILHVEEPPSVYSGEEYLFSLSESDPDALRRMLDRVRPTDPEVTCEHWLIGGEPATEIVRFAQEQEVDIIVLGTHGRSGLSRLLMGSVAEAVVRRATCPVLTYKQPTKVPTH